MEVCSNKRVLTNFVNKRHVCIFEKMFISQITVTAGGQGSPIFTFIYVGLSVTDPDAKRKTIETTNLVRKTTLNLWFWQKKGIRDS